MNDITVDIQEIAASYVADLRQGNDVEASDLRALAALGIEVDAADDADSNDERVVALRLAIEAVHSAETACVAPVEALDEEVGQDQGELDTAPEASDEA